MNNAIYSAVLGSRIEMFRLDVVANNVANASTPGYKADIPVFSAHLDHISKSEFNPYRQALKNVNDYFETSCRFTPGDIMHTGRQFDMALEGDGFFVVQTPRGEGFTRAGNFQIDTDGNLITTKGYSVMGDGGAIVIDTSKEITVTKDGTIFAGTEELDRFRVVDFSNKGGLRKIAGGAFINSAGATAIADPNFTVTQGFLEGSNINPVREMAALVMTGRQFEVFQKTITLVDGINSRATQTLGNI